MATRRHTEFDGPDLITPIHEIEAESGTAFRDRVLAACQIIWAHKRFLLTVALRSAVVFLAVAVLLPSTYTSKTELMPPDSQSPTASMLAAFAGSSSLGGASSLESGPLSLIGNMLGLKTSGSLFISILQSDAVENDIINRFDLRREYWVGTYKKARKKLASRTSIDEDTKSGVITIEVTDRNPQRATAIAQAYVDELNHLVISTNTSSAHRERVFLEGRLKVVKQELDQASKQLSDYSSKHSTLDLKAQGQAMLDAAATLQGQLVAAESELRGLEQIYTPYNIRIKTVRARIAELQHQIEELGGAPTNAEPDLDSEQLYPSIRQLPLVGLTFTDLYRRVKIDETVYEVLRKEYEMARVEEAKEIPTVKVLVPPEHPETPSGPPRLLIFFGGVLLALLLGCGWILGRDSWDRTDAENPRKLFAQGVAAEVRHNFHWKRLRQLQKQALADAFWRSNHRPPTNHNGHFE
jgi:uncharacterized protein involved in exopolysaccharide biosynthesis